MSGKWTAGNDIRLLENGEEFFPRVFACIANAKREDVLETFILFEDKVGLQLHEALVAAAQRGVQVDVTIDGFGSPDLSKQFISSLCETGVRLHVFDPGNRVLGQRINLLRRMHRKIVVVDAEVAFVGGINYSADHLGDFGPEAKQDYSVEIRGPLVAEIHRFTHGALAAGMRHQRQRQWWRNRKQVRTTPQELPRVGSAECIFVTRDNGDHLIDIERHYRIAIRAALQLPPAWHMGNHGLQWVGIGQQKVAYAHVLTVLLVGAIAGVVAHMPAGLGVFEFVFVGLLSHQASQGHLLAALLGYRAIYYIGPTLVAAAMYLAFELKARRSPKPDGLTAAN